MSMMDFSQTESCGDQVIVDVENPTDANMISSETMAAQCDNISIEAVPPRRGRKRNSTVWEYFIEVATTSKGVAVTLLQCTSCGIKFRKSKSGTTSQLLRHIKECDKIKSKRKELIDLPDKKQRRLNLMPLDAEREIEMPMLYDPKTYNQQMVREVIAKMIIVHEYPFMIVEHVWFNILLKILNPHYERVSRNTIKNDCIKVYETEKEKLKSYLKDIRRVSLTSDCWTSNQTVGYMCVTVHFIDDNWQLQQRIINFIELEPPHTGTFICDAICDCLLEWNLQDKVSTITLDNASNNDVAASSLKDNFASRGKLHYEGLFFHVRCCAHILNIMVQDGLKEVQDVIFQIRETVKYLKKSPARLHKFVEVSKQLGISTSKGLCIDVQTRWNSTYLMLESAFAYRNVFNHYAVRDNNYTWLPSDSDWAKYEKLRKFLEVFNNVTKMISGSSYPTTNIFLPTVMHVKKLLMEESIASDEFMRNMARAMKIKFDKYWGECNLLMSVAAVLDPRLKLKFINFTFPKIYLPDEFQSKAQDVCDAVWAIYTKYAYEEANCSTSVVGSNEASSSSSHVPNLVSNFDCMLGFTDYVLSSGSVQPPKSDLQIYLEEGLFTPNNDKFEVLEWWKMNSLKYPCLSKMAKDILTIPITTVASESAFSAGGRVLDDYRSCLATKSVNALVCAGSWIRCASKYAKTPMQELLDEENLSVKFPD